MSYAASRYSQQSGGYLTPREIEMMAFVHVNGLMSEAVNMDARRAALMANHKLWSILLIGVQRVDCPLPTILRNDLITLGVWVVNWSNRALNNTEALSPLININKDMIEGLSAQTTPSASIAPNGAFAPPIEAVGERRLFNAISG